MLRGIDPTPADVGTVRARSARDLVVDPALVAEARDEGFHHGYEAGFAQGLQDSAAAIDARELARGDQVRNLVEQLALASDTLAQQHAMVIADIEARLVAIAAEIAATVVGHELAIAETPGLDALRRALQFAPAGSPVVAHLHADDLATLGGDTVVDGRALSLMADVALAPGDCVVDIGATHIDARIAPAFERIRAVLAGDQP